MPDHSELVLATNNLHKAREISRLFPGFRLRTPGELGVEFSHEEKGSSFFENAMGKALNLFPQVSRPVLADDSGLCVPALHGEPGIRSARYGELEAGRRLTDRERIDALLGRLQAVTDRSCRFVCCLVWVLGEDRILVAQETVEGRAAFEPRGQGGFGYDPIFIIPELNRTMAELDEGEKDRLSHRGRAARRLLAAYRGM